MRKVCAWCRQPMNDEAEDNSPVSHGMCDACLENALLHGTSIWSTIDMKFSPARGTTPANRKRSGSMASG